MYDKAHCAAVQLPPTETRLDRALALKNKLIDMDDAAAQAKAAPATLLGTVPSGLVPDICRATRRTCSEAMGISHEVVGGSLLRDSGELCKSETMLVDCRFLAFRQVVDGPGPGIRGEVQRDSNGWPYAKSKSSLSDL